MSKKEDYEKRARMYAEAVQINIDPDKKRHLTQHECNLYYFHYLAGVRVGENKQISTFQTSLIEKLEEEVLMEEFSALRTDEQGKHYRAGLQKAIELIKNHK